MSNILDREDFVKLVWSSSNYKEDKLLAHDAALREMVAVLKHDWRTAEDRIAELEREIGRFVRP